MSAQASVTRTTSVDIRARKGGEPIVSLTAYHAHTAAIADKHVDFLLVGDSLGMVMHGYETTVPVPLELMIMHGRAVVRGAKRALVVVDMPFGSYEESPPVAFRNAAHVLKETGCGAVKLEGGRQMAETIRYLVERGIPVMAHIGLTPQAINTLGGFRAQGRTRGPVGAAGGGCDGRCRGRRIRHRARGDRRAAGRSASPRRSPVPTIGIGASAACDGQILVMEDMLGLSPRVPKFVKEFGRVGAAIDSAISAYAAEVRGRSFPGGGAHLCDEERKEIVGCCRIGPGREWGYSRIPPSIANPVPMIRNRRMKTQEGPAFSDWSSILRQTQAGRECRQLAPMSLRMQMMRDVMAEIPERRIEARVQTYVGESYSAMHCYWKRALYNPCTWRWSTPGYRLSRNTQRLSPARASIIEQQLHIR